MKNKRRRSLSGAVLIMVLTVMFVLIIMLLATLTVVTTASQRIYTKFEENQAYYSARSALDVFTQKMLSDEKYYAQTASAHRGYAYNAYTEATSPDKMTQGLALQLDLYKITAQSGDNIDQSLLRAYANALTGADKRNEYLNYFGTDSTAVRTDSAGNEFIEYRITTFPDLSSDKYGKMFEKNGTAGYEATLKVEILERTYNYDAALIPTGKTLAQLLAPTASASDKQAAAKAIAKGAREKDKMRVKITSTVEFMGTEGKAVLIYDTATKPPVNSSNAITSVSYVEGDDSLRAVGGASAMSGGLTLKNDSIVCGDLYIIGNHDGTTNNFSLASGARSYMFADTMHVIRGGMTYSNDIPVFEEKGSVIYSTEAVNITYQINSGGFGASGKETNIIAHAFNFASNGKTTDFWGNIYCDDFSISGGAVDLVMNSSKSGEGHIYTNYLDVASCATVNGGSLEFNGGTPQANSKMTVYKGFIIDVTDGGVTKKEHFDYDPSANTITSTTLSPVVTYSLDTATVPAGLDLSNCGTSNELKINYSNPTHYTMTADKKKEFTLPAKLAGRTEDTVAIPTSYSNYKEVYKPGAFTDAATDTGTNGDLNAIVMPSVDVSAISAVDGDGNPIASTIVEGVVNGTINDGNFGSYGITYNDWYTQTTSWWPVVTTRPGIKDSVNNAVDTYKSTDPTYMAALAAYYANYISGAEKAEVTNANLLEYTSASTPIKMDSLPTIDWSTVDLSKYSATDQTAIKSTYATSKVINSSGYIMSDTKYGQIYGTSSNPVIIDATVNDITIQLGAENGNGTNQEGNNNELRFRGYFVVIGDRTVKFLLPDGDSTGKERNYALGNLTASGQGFHAATYDIEKLIKTGATDALRIVSSTSYDPNFTPAPNIYLYAGNGVKSVTLGAPDDGFFTGYIYSPFAKYQFGAGSGRTFSGGLYYNNVSIASSGGYSIVGSIICAGYESGNKVGVAYINPNTTSTKPGEPIHDWKANLYTRN